MIAACILTSRYHVHTFWTIMVSKNDEFPVSRDEFTSTTFLRRLVKTQYPMVGYTTWPSLLLLLLFEATFCFLVECYSAGIVILVLMMICCPTDELVVGILNVNVAALSRNANTKSSLIRRRRRRRKHTSSLCLIAV
jgi:hypothetical protein